MGTKVKVTLYPNKIRKLQEIAQKAFELTVEAVLSDIRMSQTVPKNTGELERSGFVEIDIKKMVAKIIFDEPYARRLYWHPEYDFRQDKNQYAGGLWMQTYIDGEKRHFVKETYGKFLKQLGGGMVA
ncbi:minor capsid protein [Blautia producta]|uniref:minor capsid protein n=1 Tax=Blautia producta TaxID=33035 RepID=UPI001D05283E|nr:minor capsid protein [Blautia producta]MCB5876699.1 minor capsid protein [Blautia producta]